MLLRVVALLPAVATWAACRTKKEITDRKRPRPTNVCNQTSKYSLDCSYLIDKIVKKKEIDYV